MLFLQHLNSQRQLASVSSLRHVPVEDGFKQLIAELHVMGVVNGVVDRRTFVKIVGNLLLKRDGHLNLHEKDVNSIFNSMMFDESDMLSLGEWSGGLSVFFEGTQEEKTQALFEFLDQDGDGCLSKKELKEYLAPLVKSMTPSEALPMQPILLELCANQFMQILSVTMDGKVSRDKFFQFHSEHNIIDALSHMIDSNVYQIWVKQNMNCQGDGEDKDCGARPVLHSQITTEKIHCGVCHRRVLPDPSTPYLCPLCQHYGRIDKMDVSEIQRLVVDESKPSKQPS